MSMSDTQTFLVVAFAGEDGVGVIPSQWRTGERECFWPPYKSSTRFEKAVKSVEAPQASWTRHTIRVLSTTGSYARAMILLTRAEETSDLATENEDERPSKRRKLQNRRYVSSSDDTEEEAENFTLPPPIQPLVPLTTPLTSNINPQSQRQNFPDAVVSPISARHSTGSTQSLAGSSRNISPMSTPDLIVNATQKKILMILAEIKAEVRDLKRQTVANSHLIQSLKTSHLDLEELPDDVNLPLSSVPLLTALDELARTDFNVEKRLILTLSSVGGQILPVAVRRMLQELIQNNVAKCIHWTGQGEKLAFKDLFLRKVLEKAIRKNQPTSNSTAVEIQREFVKFFKGASDREEDVRQDNNATSTFSLALNRRNNLSL
ncbi:uncharacterized protein [Apostichopus japonicus]|uniref:uncharacterized protein isoform X1 n=1 Tax=Stichopus japonicus TaxID=307972 RepID=UPI003AB4E1D9